MPTAVPVFRAAWPLPIRPSIGGGVTAITVTMVTVTTVTATTDAVNPGAEPRLP